MMIYTGIGSRSTPDGVMKTMTIIANNLEHCGFTLRSGGANGADSAFEAGVKDPDHKEIYLPWKGFNNNTSNLHNISTEALTMAGHYHPNWNACSPAARLFHARNCYQVLGEDLETPTLFVICWIPEGKTTGGTGQALRIAEDLDIPVINMGNRGWEKQFDKLMETIND